jgi:small-conductance mechanosensitive channel
VAPPFALISPLDEHLPSWLSTVRFLDLSLIRWLGLLLLAVVAVLAGTLVEWFLARLGRAVVRRTWPPGEERLLDLLAGPARALLALLLFHLLAPLLGLPDPAGEEVDRVVRSLFIVAVTWLILRLITVASTRLESALASRVADARLRTLQTYLALPRTILRCAAIVVGTSLVLVQFEVVRTVGVSLLASAGLAGVIIGLAAQRVVANLLAGIQIVLTQPIRIGDLVAMENEWGWVEEIGLTFVVVKLWDLRRLVLPVSYFLEKPFQNWARGGPALLGTVFLRTDYTVPIEAIRAEVARILDQTGLWDRRASAVQVTDLAERTVEVRVLVSARDGGQLWDLRCLVRERLLAWLRARGWEQPPPTGGMPAQAS